MDLVKVVEERFPGRLSRVDRGVPMRVYWVLDGRYGLGLGVAPEHASVHLTFYAAPKVELQALFGQPFSIALSLEAFSANLDLVEEYLKLRTTEVAS